MSANVAIRLSVSGQAQVQGALGSVENAISRAGLAQLRAAGHYAAGALALGSLAGYARQATQAFVMKADAVTALSNQLRLATGSTKLAADALQSLYGIAQASRVSFTDLGSTFASVSRTVGAMGVSQQRLLAVSEAIGNAMTVSGGSAQGMNAALVQLGQGFASGTLRGEELNSVMEQMPRLAQAIADGLGVTIGQLREMGAAGQLTSANVVRAIESQASVLRAEVQNSTATVAQSMTVLDNATTRAAAALDKATGSTMALARAIANGATDFDRLSDLMDRAAKAGESMTAQTAKAVAGFVALGAVRVAETGVNSLNYAVNLLTGNLFKFSENVNFLPRALDTTENQVRALSQELDQQKTKLAELNAEYVKRIDNDSGGMYLKAEIAEVQRYVRELQAAIDKKAELLGSVPNSSVPSGDTALARAQRAEYDDARLRLIELNNKLQGTGQEYAKTLKTFFDAYTTGLMSPEEYRRRVEDLIKTTKVGKEAADRQSEALKEHAALRKSFLESLSAQREKLAEEAAAFAGGEVAALRYQAAKLGLAGVSAKTIDALDEQSRALARLRAAQQWEAQFAEQQIDDDERQQQALRDAIAGVRKSIEGVEDETEALRENNTERQVRLQLRAMEAAGATPEQLKEMGDRLRKAIDARDVARKNREAWADEIQRIQRINDQIGQSLADALMNGGKSAAEYIKGLFRSMVLRPEIEAAVKPLAGMITGILGLGGSGAAMAGTGGGGGGLSMISALSGISNLLNGTTASMAAQSLGEWLVMNTGGTLNSLGGSLMSNAGMIGTAGGYLGGIGLGVGAGRLISNGYSIGGSGNAAVNIGTIAGAFFGGPIGAAIGGAIGGAVNSLFGRKLKDTGLEGSFGSGGDFGGSSYAYYKGGLFRSNKTVRSPLDTALEQVLDAGGKAAAEQAKAYAEALGLPVEALQGYSQQIKVSFAGMDEAAQKEAIQKLIVDFQEGLLGQFSAQLEPLRKVGETLAQTAGRLASLQTLSKGLNDLGGVFSRVANLSIEAREQLVEFAGGMESLAGLARSYVENYFNREEIAGLKAREIQDVLAGVGLDASGLSTRGDFRTLVESLDVSGEQGRRQLTALLGVQGSFAGVSDYLAESGGTLGSAAAQAPQTAVLGSLFATSAAAQVDAINGVASGVAQTNQLLGQLIDAVQQQRSLIDQWQWEVNPGGGTA